MLNDPEKTGNKQRNTSRINSMAELTLRSVQADDAHLLWTWANERSVREFSFTPEPIPWERHEAWFEDRTRDPNCRFYVALDDAGDPVGQIRFELDPTGRAEVHLSIAAEHRGRGYGTTMLRRACALYLTELPRTTIHAQVKWDNVASRRAFEKAGFSVIGREQRAGADVARFELTDSEPAEDNARG